jgi:flagellar biosynthesis protein FlhF
MRIIRFVAADTRQALRGVRAQLGEHAVILSSKRTDEGVEVTAGADIEAPLAQASAATTPAGDAPQSEVASTPAQPRESFREAPAFAEVASLARRDAATPASLADSEEPEAGGNVNVNKEIRIMRRMLESQLEQLAWNDRTRRTPVVSEMLRELTEIGVSQELAEQICQELPERVDLASARRTALTALAERLPVATPSWLEDGGCLALLGATGAGKTTSLAKIAVRWALRHGPRELALVAGDAVRIGAQDQLQSLGQLLGAPVHVPESFDKLPEVLAELTRYRLVLIDTPGTSARDPQLPARLTALARAGARVQTALVLSANSQAGALEETVKRFALASPGCCLLTKLDEATSLGGVLSVLARARLPVAYVSEGQRIPEDLQPARALDLVSAAVRLAKATDATADEDLLRRRFGKVNNVCT